VDLITGSRLTNWSSLSPPSPPSSRIIDREEEVRGGFDLEGWDLEERGHFVGGRASGVEIVPLVHSFLVG